MRQINVTKAQRTLLQDLIDRFFPDGKYVVTNVNDNFFVRVHPTSGSNIHWYEFCTTALAKKIMRKVNAQYYDTMLIHNYQNLLVSWITYKPNKHLIDYIQEFVVEADKNKYFLSKIEKIKLVERKPAKPIVKINYTEDDFQIESFLCNRGNSAQYLSIRGVDNKYRSTKNPEAEGTTLETALLAMKGLSNRHIWSVRHLRSNMVLTIGIRFKCYSFSGDRELKVITVEDGKLFLSDGYGKYPLKYARL